MAIPRDGDFYINNANQDFYLRENGVWVRKGNIRDEGSSGIVGIAPVLALGFGMGSILSRTRYLTVDMLYGFDEAVAVERIRELAAGMGYGFNEAAVLTHEQDGVQISATMGYGFDEAAAVERIRLLSPSMAYGYSQANTVTHASAGYMVVTDTASPYFRVFDPTYAKMADPSTLPTGVTTALSCKAGQFAISQNNGTVHIYDVAGTTVTFNRTLSPGIGNNIRTVKYNADGTRLLVISSSTSPYVVIYDTSSWSTVTAPAPGQSAQGGDWSQDGSEIALALITSPFMKLYQTSDMSAISNPSSVMTHQALGGRYNGSANSHLVMWEGGVSPHVAWIYRRSDLTRVSTGTTPPGSQLISSDRHSWSIDGSRFFWAGTSSPYINVYARSGDTFTADTIGTDLSTACYAIWIESNGTTMHVMAAGASHASWHIYTRSGTTWTKQTDPGNQPTGTSILGLIDGTL